MVFYPPSPRAVTPAVAADLAVHAGNAQKVGLFVDPEDALIDAVLARVALDMLQLHGSETPDRVAALRRRTGLPIMKAIKVGDVQDLAMAEAYLDSRSEEHTSELQSLMRISYAVFCLTKNNNA